MFSRLLAASASVGLMIAPVAVSASPANPASTLSVVKSARASAPTGATIKAGEGAGSIGVYIVGAALLVGFGFLVVKNAEKDDPDSN